MKIKIIKNEDVLKGNVIKRIDNLNQSVLAVSEAKKETCIEFIRYNNGEMYFNEPIISSKVYIDYPLSVTTEIEVKNIETIGELLWNIAKAYKQIYSKEDKSTKIKPESMKHLINRNQTDGKYGISFHDLGDLVFELVEIHDNNTIHLHIGS